MAAPTVEQYEQRIRQALVALLDLGSEPIALRAALGRVTAAQVRSPINLPPFQNSQMDGYAVRAQDISQAPARLPITATIAAGDRATDLTPGTAARIMTGAPLPPGADCVVPVEDTSEDGSFVIVTTTSQPGAFVRDAASDVAAGAIVVDAGALLNPQRISALAAVGTTTVEVRRQPRVAIITTGSELVPAGQELLPGEIYDSNGMTLAALNISNGAEVVSVGHSSDDPEQFASTLELATGASDVVFTSGAVSMGRFEVVREVLSQRGGRFGHIGMQPGGPQGLTCIDGFPVVSFPGNPVSALVSFTVLARPTIREAAGLPVIEFRQSTLSHDISSPLGKRQFLRGQSDGHKVRVVGGAGSHLIASMADATVLVEIPANVTTLSAGSSVRTLSL